MSTMEAQIGEIMRALGRIEQKTDTANESIESIKVSVEKQDDRILKIEIARATEKGIVKTVAIIWSGLVAFVTSVATIYFSNRHT